MNIAALLAGLLSGIIGAMGLGGGAVLIIYLSLFTETEQLKSQGINLLFFIPIALIAVIIYAIKKKIKWKLTLKISLFGIIGTLAGWYIAGFLGGEIIKKLFGGLLLFLGAKELFFKEKNKNGG
ncbi:MAG: TSUP family transporter [Clostridia bacterium]|nr:TSUP family transporter [Clostridia bacterium]